MDKEHKIRKPHINLKQRLDLIHRMDNGERKKDLASKYKISCATVTNIYRHKTEILKACKNINEETLHKKSQMKNCVAKKLDMAVLRYYQQSVSCNRQISEEILKEKASIFANMLSFKNFVSKDLWFKKFKNRYCLDLENPPWNLLKKDMKFLLDHEIINIVGDDIVEDNHIVDDSYVNENNQEINVNKEVGLNLLGVLPNDIIVNNDNFLCFADDQESQRDVSDKHKDPDETQPNAWIRNIKMTVNESLEMEDVKQPVIQALETVHNALNNFDIVPSDIFNAFYLMQDYIKKQLSEN